MLDSFLSIQRYPILLATFIYLSRIQIVALEQTAQDSDSNVPMILGEFGFFALLALYAKGGS